MRKNFQHPNILDERKQCFLNTCGYKNSRFVRWDTYARSPRIRRANWMSLGIIVTRLA